MNKRTITIFHSQTSKTQNIDTNVSKWGELQKLIEGNVSSKTCVLSGSKHVLAVDDALLPQEGFTVFVYPKESKGGATKKKVSKKPVKKASKTTKLKKKSSKSLGLSKKEEAKVASAEQLETEAAIIARQLRGYR